MTSTREARNGSNVDMGGASVDQGCFGLSEYLQKEYKLNKDLVFAAGFSNGGFMTHRLAMQGQTSFKACVSVAGKMPKVIWRDKNKKIRVGFFQITGLKDDVVPKNSDGSARHASDPAIEDVMDYWAASNKFTLVTKEEVGEGSELTKWTSAGKFKKGQVWSPFDMPDSLQITKIPVRKICSKTN